MLSDEVWDCVLDYLQPPVRAGHCRDLAEAAALRRVARRWRDVLHVPCRTRTIEGARYCAVHEAREMAMWRLVLLDRGRRCFLHPPGSAVPLRPHEARRVARRSLGTAHPLRCRHCGPHLALERLSLGGKRKRV